LKSQCNKTGQDCPGKRDGGKGGSVGIAFAIPIDTTKSELSRLERSDNS
jgi:hypothetical protein